VGRQQAEQSVRQGPRAYYCCKIKFRSDSLDLTISPRRPIAILAILKQAASLAGLALKGARPGG
jgi:hypothetical protein